MKVIFLLVNKNGKLVSNILHKQTSNKAENEENPHFEDITEVDIPGLDLHEKIVNNDGVETKVHTKRVGQTIKQNWFI